MKKVIITIGVLIGIVFVGYAIVLSSININDIAGNNQVMNQELYGADNNMVEIPSSRILPFDFEYSNSNSIYNDIRIDIASIALDEIETRYKINDSQLVRIDIETAVSNITDSTFNKWTNGSNIYSVSKANDMDPNSHSINIKIYGENFKVTFVFS